MPIVATAFLADTNGRAYATVSRPSVFASVCRLWRMYRG